MTSNLPLIRLSAINPFLLELRRRGREVLRVSGATGEGVDALLRAALLALDAAAAASVEELPA